MCAGCFRCVRGFRLHVQVPFIVGVWRHLGFFIINFLLGHSLSVSRHWVRDGAVLSRGGGGGGGVKRYA